MYQLRVTLSNHLELVHGGIQTDVGAQAVAKDTIKIDGVTRVEVQQEATRLLTVHTKDGATQHAYGRS